MDKSWRGTWYEEYCRTPKDKRKYYVYLWSEKVGEALVPFYVGMGSGRRAYNKWNRSKTLREYILGKDINQMIVATDMPISMAMYVEHRIKDELKTRGFNIIDAEDNSEERKRRQQEGIRKAVENGVRLGRPKKEISLTILPGETISDACKRLGISKATYYRKKKEI